MNVTNLLTPCFCSSGKNDNTKIESQETGLDRVKRMYFKNDFGILSPEMHFVIQSATISVSVSAFLGALISTNQAKDDYFRKNVATQFESEYLAKRRLVDTISLAAIKGGLRYGVKYGSFSSLYLLSTMTAANYNNKITVWQHIGSGALIAGLFRINYGLKGMAAAASAGGVLGAIAGGILVFSMWLTNTNFEEIRYWQSTAYLESRKRRFAEKPEDLLRR